VSEDLYTRGLWRHGESLVLRDGDLTVTVHHAKLIAAIPESEIDFGEIQPDILAYCPEVREKPGDKRRELDAPEIAALKERIAKLTAAVLAIFGIPA
jgi:hypothetical protein